MRVLRGDRFLSRVEVTWIDTAMRGGWKPLERLRAQQPSGCRTVGFLVSKTSRAIIVIQSVDVEGENGADAIVIPRSCVQSIKRLR